MSDEIDLASLAWRAAIGGSKPDMLRECLTQVRTLCRPAEETDTKDPGGQAAKRRTTDSVRSGRVAWRFAWGYAGRGLEALDAGDIDYAQASLVRALLFQNEALLCRVRPADLAELVQAPGTRGRHAKTARDRRLAAAVDRQLVDGISVKAAVAAAFQLDPALAAEFRGAGQRTIRAAYQAGKKSGR